MRGLSVIAGGVEADLDQGARKILHKGDLLFRLLQGYVVLE